MYVCNKIVSDVYSGMLRRHMQNDNTKVRIIGVKGEFEGGCGRTRNDVQHSFADRVLPMGGFTHLAFTGGKKCGVFICKILCTA